MDCARIELIAYHLGTAGPDECDQVERHLVGCTACLEAYLALKRETDHAGQERPSPELRARLRRDVAVALAVRPRRPVAALAWLARPVPRYRGLAVLAAAALAGAVASGALRLPRDLPRPEPQRVDTARPTAESLSIF